MWDRDVGVGLCAQLHCYFGARTAAGQFAIPSQSPTQRARPIYGDATDQVQALVTATHHTKLTSLFPTPLNVPVATTAAADREIQNNLQVSNE